MKRAEPIIPASLTHKAARLVARQPRVRELSRALLKLLVEEGAWLSRHPKLTDHIYRAYFRFVEEGASAAKAGSGLNQAENLKHLRAFQRQLRAALQECSEARTASALNAALQQVEFRRGLGPVASLPTHWVVHLSQLSEPWASNTEPMLSLFRCACEFTVVADVWPAPNAERFDALRDMLFATERPVRVLVRQPALLEPKELSTFLDAFPCTTLILEFASSQNRALVGWLAQEVAALLHDWNSENGRRVQVEWQFVLNKENLAWLEECTRLAQTWKPKSIALFLERAWSPEAVARSLFFSQDEARRAIADFVTHCTEHGIKIVASASLVGKDGPDSSLYARAYGSAHFVEGSRYCPCVQYPAFSTETPADWDEEPWLSLRQELARGQLNQDCYECGVPTHRNVWEACYLLAAYDAANSREPSAQYLEAVRRALDSVENNATARRLNAEIRNMEHRLGLHRVASYPHRMYIEVTDECNLRCPMCTQTVLSGPRKRISLDVFAKVRPLLRYMDLVHFTGCGETFLHPQLMDMLAEVPHEHCAVRIITNGLLLDEATSRRLIEIGLHELWISIDGVDAATFEKIRGSKLFHRVIENVRTLTRLRKEMQRARPRVALNFVAQRSNIEQLPDFVRMAKELGADAVNVGFLQVYSRELLVESLYFYQELSDHYMAEAKRVAQEVGIDLYVPGFFKEGRAAPVEVPTTKKDYHQHGAQPKCVEPYGFVLVHADGTLGPCCVNDSRLGSLQEKDFVEAWTAPLYQDFRRRVSTPEEDFDCQHCMLEGYKDIREFEHHAKLFDKNYQRANVDYEALEQEVREEIARRQSG